MNLEKVREDLQKKDQRRQNTGGVRDLERACSPMVEHIVCNDEIRVRFSAGPYS